MVGGAGLGIFCRRAISNAATGARAREVAGRCWPMIASIMVLVSLAMGTAYSQSPQPDKGNALPRLKVVHRLFLNDYLQAIAWSADGAKLAALSKFGSLITIWDTQTWKKLREISQYGGTYAGDSLAWTSDG